MSVIGIDIGNENSYIAVARAGGIETIANEYSQRSTPTYVAFGEKTRDLGVSAKNKQITNLKNTIFGFKRLIGRKFKDPVIQNELGYLPFSVCELPNGDVGFRVTYLGEENIFTVTQVMAMMLTKFKDIAEHNLRIKVQDCVISVPIYFTDVERRAMLDAAEIAGLNPLKLMNEPAAVALTYGFYKQDLPEDKPRNIIFVDLGNSIFQVTACAFTKGKVKVLASTWDRVLGGRDFDNTLARRFVEEFNPKYKLDIMSNKRALVRLVQECEKLKKQMSANSLELPLNIECFMDDKDVSGRMKRETFEELCSELFTRIESVMLQLVQETKLRPDDIDSVQLVGGSSRLPAIKLLVQKIFGKEPSTTLNQDEAVARGCALQCAMLSPTFKVRDFSITDIQPYPIKLSWKALKVEDSEMEVFPRFHQVPFSRMLTFYRMEPFVLEASYTGDDESYGESRIGTYIIQNVVPSPEGENAKVKVKAKLNIHGIFSVYSASMMEKKSLASVVSREKIHATDSEAKLNIDEPMDSEKTPPNGDINETVSTESIKTEETEKRDGDQNKAKNVVKSVDLPIDISVPQLMRHELNDLIEKEAKMIMQDKMEKEKADAKNAVEEYVYDMRGKISDVYEKFVGPEEKETFRKLLDDTEDWLYDKGADEQKSVYAKELAELKKIGDPIVFRYTEWEQRSVAINEFGRSLQLVHKALDSYAAKEEQYSHISEEEMDQVKKLWQEKDQWLGSYLSILSKLKQHEEPPITSAQIRKEREEFENKLRPILNKPKPKVTPPADDHVTAASGDNEHSDMKNSQSPHHPNPPQSSPSEEKTASSTEHMET